ncbi:hypothetical protein EUAN_11980 [Andreesenia angusta]|uniref:YicC-like family, N-terminal region n=1 Tax=Andreesenia angusta TaxID=39480 RepID=A0A1S1V7Q1_9FIRM|nr:YicC/YloC family endoribonuclease [Andreesenia angusta]OHW62633.1 hypothetical protein EUAN_11980 [Andreesenia angusta]
MKSMTGYGRGEFQESNKSFVVEIKTINHRYNDILVKMPRHISHLEEMVKRSIKEKVNRGRVEVYINMESVEGNDVEVAVNLALAKSYKEAAEKISRELSIAGELSLESIMKFPDVLKAEKLEDDEDELKRALYGALEKAIEALVGMRSREGEKLREDMIEKLGNIDSKISEIEKRAPLVVSEYKEKLNQRISDMLEGKYELDESRLANEVAYFADKSGIDEELVRLRSHISQARSTAQSEGAVGKKLDFIVQEMNREANTIGSKVGDIDITNMVVDIKTEIEKVREQVQNIE